jgi:hypothetical protein
MKHLSKFTLFSINEGFTNKDEIKEILEDYLLELIDEGYENSKINLTSYVDPEDFQRLKNGEELQALSTSSYMSQGSVPFYIYVVNLSKFHSFNRILNIKKRIKGDSNFLLWSLTSTTSQSLRVNEEVDESTQITIKFMYNKDKGASEPEIVTEVNPELKKLGYGFKVDQFGRSYTWRKRFSKQVELPNEWFSKVRRDGVYLLKTAHYTETQKMISELFEPKVQEEYKKLKLIFPNLSEFVKKERRFEYRATSTSDKISVEIYSNVPDKDNLTDKLVDFELVYQVHYWDKSLY